MYWAAPAFGATGLAVPRAGTQCGRPAVLVVCCLLLTVTVCGCRRSAGPTSRSASDRPGSQSPFVVSMRRQADSGADVAQAEPFCSGFVDIAERVGFDFAYQNGEAGRSLMVEAIGGGAGWLDFDCDGHWDLYVVQGGDPSAVDRSGQPGDRLFRNTTGEAFADVTEPAGIDQQGYGQGVAVGDYDNDGFDDIYITNVGPNVLLRNMGDGSFLDVTEMADVAGGRWSSSAAWADLDADGGLDLYVCNYLAYDPLDPIDC